MAMVCLSAFYVGMGPLCSSGCIDVVIVYVNDEVGEGDGEDNQRSKSNSRNLKVSCHA